MHAETANSILATLTLTLAQAGGQLLSRAVAYWLAIGLIAAGSLVIAIVLIFLFRSRAAPGSGLVAGTDAPLAAESRPEPMTDEAQMLLRLMGDAEDLCHRLGSELDAKADRVERLLARLDGRLGSAETSAQANPPASPLSPASAAQPSASNALDTPRPEIVTRPIAVPVPAASMASSAEASPRSGAAGSEVDPLTAQIYKLADAGLPSGEIARTLRQHTGKVELILALRGR